MLNISGIKVLHSKNISFESHPRKIDTFHSELLWATVNYSTNYSVIVLRFSCARCAALQTNVTTKPTLLGTILRAPSSHGFS